MCILRVLHPCVIASPVVHPSDVRHHLCRALHCAADGSVLHLHGPGLQRRLLKIPQHLWLGLEPRLYRGQLRCHVSYTCVGRVHVHVHVHVQCVRTPHTITVHTQPSHCHSDVHTVTACLHSCRHALFAPLVLSLFTPSLHVHVHSSHCHASHCHSSHCHASHHHCVFTCTPHIHTVTLHTPHTVTLHTPHTVTPHTVILYTPHTVTLHTPHTVTLHTPHALHCPCSHSSHHHYRSIPGKRPPPRFWPS